MKNTFTFLILFLLISEINHLYAQSPGWFTNVTNQLGMNVPSTFRASIADVNNDDYPDIVAVSIASGSIYTTRSPMRVYLNVDDPGSSDPKDRKFIDVTAQSNLNEVPPDTGQNANCFTLADFNNDGNIDLVTGIYYHRVETYTLPNDRCQVYLGDGTGKFNHLPNSGLPGLGLINVRAFSAMDYDRDGNLDLFIASWFKDYTNNVWDHGYLLKGNGDGTFTDVTTTSGIGNFNEPMYGSAATDWNNDCLPDVFTAPYCRTGGIAFKNTGNGKFQNVAGLIGYDLYKMGDNQIGCTFSVVPEDVDNDGDMDLFLCVVHGGNDAGEYRSTIAINKGPEHDYAFDIKYDLLPVAAPASSHRGDYNASFLDFNNDGLKDVVMVQGTYQPATDRTYFWMQQSDHTFKDVTSSLGLLLSELKSTGGVEPFDFDLDGDDDLLVGGTNGSTVILRNNIGSSNSWVAVKLTHPGSEVNKSCIGARAYVYYQGKMQMREVLAGRGQHTGQQPFILNFGLDNATSIDSIVVKWPGIGCEKTSIHHPAVNSMVSFIQYNVAIEAVDEQILSLKVFPNPTSDYAVIQAPGLIENLEGITVTDVTGKKITLDYAASDLDKVIFRFSAIPAGVYFLDITLKNGSTLSRKVIKQ